MIAIQTLASQVSNLTPSAYLLLVAIFGPKSARVKKCDSQVTHKFIETEIAKCLLSPELCKFLIETLVSHK